MGAIKGVFLIFFSILLILSSFFTILFFSLNQSMTYNNFENTSLNLVNKYLINNQSLYSTIDEELGFIRLYCQENPNNLSISDLEYSFNFSDYKIKITCDNINDTNLLVNESVKSLVHDIYFKDYNCSFMDCFNKEQIPLFLASQKTYLFLQKTFFISFIISICLIIFIFLLLKNKSNVLLFFSIPLFVSSFIFLKLTSFLPTIIGGGDLINEIVNILFYKSNELSKKLIILSGILFFGWIIVKIFKSSMKIEEKFSKIKNKFKSKESENKKNFLDKEIDKNNKNNKTEDNLNSDNKNIKK